MERSEGAPGDVPLQPIKNKTAPAGCKRRNILNLWMRLGLLQLRFPFVKNGSFNRANRQTSTAIDAGRVIDVCVLSVFRIQLAVRPVDTLDWTDRNTIRYSFANISDYGVGHLANSSQLLIASNL
jgi:hypothetical protein